MKSNEKEIIKRIQENPFISQQELAEFVGLSRPAVANIISNLIKKEYVLGKAYVLNENYPIVCIGAANIDRKFYVHKELQLETSNPVTSTYSIGGVGRNIAENLGKLGESVALLTTAGNDSEFQKLDNLSKPFMNTDHIQLVENGNTGSYTALINKDGDMEYGLADMQIYDFITPEFLIKRTHLLIKAKCIVVDLNLSKDAIEFLCAYSEKHNIKLVVIPVSSPKMKNMPDTLHAIDWIIVNKDETEAYHKIKIENLDDLKYGADLWGRRGVSNVIVTNGSNQLVYHNSDKTIVKNILSSNKMVDATGAGDSFSSAVIFSWLNGEDIEKILYAGMANAKKTIETKYTVRQNLDKKQLQRDMEEYKNEQRVH